VLLLNAILTVRAGAAASHQNQGWENFTDAVIDVINREHQGVVFLLWGSKAQKKGERVDRNRHLVLHAAHPSPLAQNKFTGCRHFSQTNAWLQQQGHPPIQWQV
jgi:uracil-DNA glycosylase